MIAYHEVLPDTVNTVLAQGLKRTSRGAKGDDAFIIKADRYLDGNRPHDLKVSGVSRDNNIYAYVSLNNRIVDIADGTFLPLEEFIARSTHCVLQLDLDPRRCFVSDLDTYDAIKQAIQEDKEQDILERLARSYWDKLIRLINFKEGSIRRPEIMVTYDITPDKLNRLS